MTFDQAFYHKICTDLGPRVSLKPFFPPSSQTFLGITILLQNIQSPSLPTHHNKHKNIWRQLGFVMPKPETRSFTLRGDTAVLLDSFHGSKMLITPPGILNSLICLIRADPQDVNKASAPVFPGFLWRGNSCGCPHHPQMQLE